MPDKKDQPETDAAEPTTAPQLSTKLSKQLDGKNTKPVSGEKLDKLITESEKAEAAKKTPAKPKAEVPKDTAGQGDEFDDAETDKAVDDIVAYEGDVVLAVADSTAAEHNREVAASQPKGHPILGIIIWTCVALVAVLVIVLGALLVMGDSIADKLGL